MDRAVGLALLQMLEDDEAVTQIGQEVRTWWKERYPRVGAALLQGLESRWQGVTLLQGSKGMPVPLTLLQGLCKPASLLQGLSFCKDHLLVEALLAALLASCFSSLASSLACLHILARSTNASFKVGGLGFFRSKSFNLSWTFFKA